MSCEFINDELRIPNSKLNNSSSAQPTIQNSKFNIQHSTLQHTCSNASCLCVRSYIVVVCRLCDECGTLHRSLDDVCHLQESAAVVAERLIHHFVGSVHDTRHVATATYRLVCHCETAELLHVGLEELEWLTEGKKFTKQMKRVKTLLSDI